MKIFGLEINRASPVRKERAFTAAKINRLTYDWASSVTQVNEDIKSGLVTLKVRSREMSKNNNYFRKYLSMCERNIVGPNGIELQMKVADANGSLDGYANDAIEKGWYDWCRREHCDISGQVSFIDMLKLAVRSLKVDGEAFVRIHRGSGKYGVALQIIDSMACDITHNMTFPDGRRIIMGVEVDSYYRPLAYYFKSSVSETTYYAGKDDSLRRVRIPAGEIFHLFRREFPGQVRGYPVACSSMLAMNNLNGYSEAELIAARVSACKMGFYETSDSGLPPADDSADGQYLSEAAPGKFEVLPPGTSFKDFNPTHPQGNYAGFVQAQLREIAGGLDVSYNSLASDLTSVNFSSMRSGALEERDSWKMDQRYLVENLCEPVFSEWLTMFLTSGMTSLPLAKYDKFHADTWVPRAWQWVDPQSDATANITLMNQGLKSPQQIAAEMGQDLEDIYKSIQKSEQMKTKYGVVTMVPGQTTNLQNPPPVDKPDKNEGNEKEKQTDEQE